MSDWSGGYGTGGRPANAKIPVKVHRRVCLIRCDDSFLADELLSRGRVAQLVVGRLTNDTLLAQAEKVPELVEELRKMGHTPRVDNSR